MYVYNILYGNKQLCAEFNFCITLIPLCTTIQEDQHDLSTSVFFFMSVFVRGQEFIAGCCWCRGTTLCRIKQKSEQNICVIGRFNSSELISF